GCPEQRSHVGDNRMTHDAISLWHFDPLEPVRKSLRHVLLPESLASDPRRISLHRYRPANQVRQHHRRDGCVVLSQLALGDPIVWKELLLRMRDHDCSRTTSRGFLSARMLSSRGCRSFPCTVHSMKPTCTTIPGRTQWP